MTATFPFNPDTLVTGRYYRLVQEAGAFAPYDRVVRYEFRAIDGTLYFTPDDNPKTLVGYSRLEVMINCQGEVKP